MSREQEILSLMMEGCFYRPRDIADQLKIDIGHASKLLRELHYGDLIALVISNDGKGRKYIYQTKQMAFKFDEGEKCNEVAN